MGVGAWAGGRGKGKGAGQEVGDQSPETRTAAPDGLATADAPPAAVGANQRPSNPIGWSLEGAGLRGPRWLAGGRASKARAQAARLLGVSLCGACGD